MAARVLDGCWRFRPPLGIRIPVRTLLVLAALLLLASNAATADTNFWTFTFTSPTITASGELGGVPSPLPPVPDVYTIDSGFVNLVSPTYHFSGNLYPNPNAPVYDHSPANFFNYDDQLDPTGGGSVVDGFGLLFVGTSTPSGPTEVNFYYNLNPGFTVADVQGAVTDAGTFTLTATAPEPGVVPLLLTMMAAMGALIGVLKRKPS
jgi:hypothetical protein